MRGEATLTESQVDLSNCRAIAGNPPSPSAVIHVLSVSEIANAPTYVCLHLDLLNIALLRYSTRVSIFVIETCTAAKITLKLADKAVEPIRVLVYGRLRIAQRF